MASKFEEIQTTIGGSDLSVFYMQELPNLEDIGKGFPLEICRKEILMMDFDSVLSISYSTIRERFPSRRLGEVNPISYTSGLRSISGHIAFNIFTNDVLSRLRGQVTSYIEKSMGSIYESAGETSGDRINSIVNKSPLSNSGFKTMLLDQLPPFHLLIMGVTEHTNQLSRMLLKNVYIVDENQYHGTQQPNIVNKVTFVCQDVVPMTKQQYDSTLVTSSLTALEEKYVGGDYEYSSLGPDLTGGSLLLDMYYDTKANNNTITSDFTRR